MKLVLKLLLFILIGMLFSNCSSSLFRKCTNAYDMNYKGRYKIGDPYVINKVTYYPHHNPHYEEVGYASWYGDDFHCKKTANGEVFNKWQLSAAHRTLPLPSIVRVTNLHNNKSVNVLVNDRGPFVKNRIIDLSERAAEALSMKRSGVAKVKVEYLSNESNVLLAQLNMHQHIKSSPYKNNKPILLAQSSSKQLNKTYNISDNTEKQLVPQDIAIVVGKYRDKKDALKTIKNLSAIGYTKLSQAINKGQPMYEVQLASAIKDQRQAKILLKKIIALGNPNAYVTQR